MSDSVTIRETDNRSTAQLRQYNLQLIMERDALRQEVGRLREMLFKGTNLTRQPTRQLTRQAHKETVRHE